MKHNEQAELNALLYSYGELEDSAEHEFLVHLKECPICQNIVSTVSATAAALPQLKAPEAPAFIPAPKPRKALFSLEVFPFRRLIPVGALALIVALAGIAVYRIDKSRNHYSTSIENMYSQVSEIETEVQDILEYIENM